MRRAIAICCWQPDIRQVKFYSQIEGYDIYFIYDNVSFILSEYFKSFTNIKFISIQDFDAIQAGYSYSHSSNFMKYYLKTKRICFSLDKALYYFCELNETYDQVWFIEDDVFVPSIHTLQYIDTKYDTIDLLCERLEYLSDSKKSEHWFDVINYLSMPLYKSMACAQRMSKSVLHLIKQFAKQHTRLCFHEIMITTVSHQNNLSIKVIPELKGILWRHDWKSMDIHQNGLFHPVKDQNTQERWHAIYQYRSA